MKVQTWDRTQKIEKCGLRFGLTYKSSFLGIIPGYLPLVSSMVSSDRSRFVYSCCLCFGNSLMKACFNVIGHVPGERKRI